MVLLCVGCDRPHEAARPPNHQPETLSPRVQSEPRPADDNALTGASRPLMFKGYPCTVDCSGHDAGYRWAEKRGIADPDDCTGNSRSFIEGCRSYAEEAGEADDGEHDDEE